MRTHTAVIVSLLLAGCAPGPSAPQQFGPQTAMPSLATSLEWEAAARGRAIALAGCAGCHAIDRQGASPMAAAPPFRDIVARRSLHDIQQGMAQGLVTAHPAMPRYDFRASEIDDLRAYFEILRADIRRRQGASRSASTQPVTR
ncbi:c-type cytochrome [Brevundimonas goettingensis]|uniref:C-type cytochrome n=1 Tax=Brevundimonas goettingensis TaxID=2774190 RepID=A0A975C2B2_9CAUL|nr:c-type cytochrome [Brevundimonas goettingensis]QTC92210.1 c-type cytochrome [Brevundimonas goettingensis]